jgi:D-arabinose 1-dehydrogenase-like Zn-dependent alcohol dehydrogenase
MTVYTPLRDHGFPGAKVGVVGMGGLGHLAIKFGAVMGMEMTAISRSADKRQEMMDMGAHGFVVSTDEDQMRNAKFAFDLVIVVATTYKISDYIELVKAYGKMVLVSPPPRGADLGFNWI